MKDVDYLIIGQGLAGSILSWELMQKGMSVAVIDEGKKVTSSKIAAGMFNPINTKRFTVSHNAAQNIHDALSVYSNMEKVFDVKLIHHSPIYNVFGNVKESNDYSLKLENSFFKQYTNPNPTLETNIINPYGAFEVSLSGWIDIPKLLAAVKDYISKRHVYLEEKFKYSELLNLNQRWHYQSVVARKVVFCEGVFAHQNPYFNKVNIIPCKGDILEFYAPELKLEKVVKKGIYIIPLGNNYYKCGSTYKWENANELLHEDDYNDLKQKIAELIKVPFNITKHSTAIRPTTKTREPLWQEDIEFKDMYFINGLGTKGVVNGILIIRQFISTQFQ